MPGSSAIRVPKAVKDIRRSATNSRAKGTSGLMIATLTVAAAMGTVTPCNRTERHRGCDYTTGKCAYGWSRRRDQHHGGHKQSRPDSG